MADTFFGQFQSEHEFSSDVFNDGTTRKAVLKRLGYEENMVSNRRALFSDPDIVAQLESAPENHPFKVLLRANGWGTVYHPGGVMKFYIANILSRFIATGVGAQTKLYLQEKFS